VLEVSYEMRHVLKVLERLPIGYLVVVVVAFIKDFVFKQATHAGSGIELPSVYTGICDGSSFPLFFTVYLYWFGWLLFLSRVTFRRQWMKEPCMEHGVDVVH